MDPDACLQKIKELCKAIIDSEVEPSDEVNDLIEHIEALDEWMTRGGFLPQDWATTRVDSMHQNRKI